MARTNHRVNKDRAEKLSEPIAHKTRRGAKQKAQHLVEQFSSFEDEDSLYDDVLADDYLETFEKTRRRHG